MNRFFHQIRKTYAFMRKKYYYFVYVKLDIAWQRLRLTGYRDGLIEVIDGEGEQGKGAFAVFVVFPGSNGLDPSIWRALASMKRNGIDVLVVSNSPLSEVDRKALAPFAWRIMLRRNIGFDFGAYKDGVLYLTRERPDLQRLLILNDSVFYSSRGLDEYFHELLGPEDSISAFENWGEGYHMQSFGLSCSGHVFRSRSFQAFWANYEPIGNRIHAIENGEKRLSDACLASSCHSRVIYNVARLMQEMKDDSSDERIEDFIVPMHWRTLLNTPGNAPFRVAERYKTLADIVNITSPVHSGAYLFPYYSKCPIYKKDLVYRQRFQCWELSHLLARILPKDEYDEFMISLRQKADYKRLPTKALRLYEIGVK